MGDVEKEGWTLSFWLGILRYFAHRDHAVWRLRESNQ